MQLVSGGRARFVRAGEQIAIGPVLEALPQRIKPVSEYLAAEQMAANAHVNDVTEAYQMIMAKHKVINIANFVRGMMIPGYFAVLHQGNRVMICRRLAAITTQERTACCSVRQLNFVRR